MRFPTKATKYGAIRTEYAGLSYASKAEAKRAADLDFLVKSGEIFWWLPQVKFRLGCPENVFVVDFLVISTKGIRVEDVKGVETAKFKRDRKLWAAYGPCPLWVIKGRRVEMIIPKHLEQQS